MNPSFFLLPSSPISPYNQFCTFSDLEANPIPAPTIPVAIAPSGPNPIILPNNPPPNKPIPIEGIYFLNAFCISSDIIPSTLFPSLSVPPNKNLCTDWLLDKNPIDAPSIGPVNPNELRKVPDAKKPNPAPTPAEPKEFLT